MSKWKTGRLAMTSHDKMIARRFTEILKEWHAGLEAAEQLEGIERTAASLRANMKACVAFDQLKAIDLNEPRYDVSVRQLTEKLEDEEANPMSLNEFRTRVLGIFYQSGLRSPLYGEKDSPMDHARLLTADYEEQVRHNRPLDDIELLDRKAQTIDRTQRRYKRSLAGQKMLKIDWGEQTVDVVDAVEALFQNHPPGPGRPRKPSEG